MTGFFFFLMVEEPLEILPLKCNAHTRSPSAMLSVMARRQTTWSCYPSLPPLSNPGHIHIVFSFLILKLLHLVCKKKIVRKQDYCKMVKLNITVLFVFLLAIVAVLCWRGHQEQLKSVQKQVTLTLGFQTHTHADTSPDHNGALDCTQSASRRQVLTFPKCLHSTCYLVLPQCRCQSPEFTQSDYQGGGWQGDVQSLYSSDGYTHRDDSGGICVFGQTLVKLGW